MEYIEDLLNENSIAFNRRKILLRNVKENKNNNSKLLISFYNTLANKGYLLDQKLLQLLTDDDIINICKDLEKSHIPGLSYTVNRNTKFYTNLIKLELIKKEKDFTKIDLITEEEFNNIPTEILSNKSISWTKYLELQWFIKNKENLINAEKSLKENLFLLVPTNLNISFEINDVLKYLLLLIKLGDIREINKIIKQNNLKKLKYKKLHSLKRTQRKFICKKINEIIEKQGLEKSLVIVKQYKYLWILASKILHPGDYAKYYDNCWKLFYTLKNNKEKTKIKSWEGELQELYNSKKSIEVIANKLTEKPKEFIKRFDSLIRRAIKSNKEDEILGLLLELNIDNKSLMKLYDYYNTRNRLNRTYIDKKYINNTIKLKKLKTIKLEDLYLIKLFITKKIINNIKNNKTNILNGKLYYLDPNIEKIPIINNIKNNKTNIPNGKLYYLDPNIEKIPIINFKNPKNLTVKLPENIQYNIPENINTIKLFVKYKDINTETIKNKGIITGFLQKNEKLIEISKFSNYSQLQDTIIHSEKNKKINENNCKYIEIVNLEKLKKENYNYLIIYNYNYSNNTNYNIGFELKNNLQIIEQKEFMNCEKEITSFVLDIKNDKIILVNSNINNIVDLELISPMTNVKTVSDYYINIEIINSYIILKNILEASGATVIDSLPEIENNNIIKISTEDVINNFRSLIKEPLLMS